VPAAAKSPKRRSESRKLSYGEQRELDALPRRIEALEAELEDVQRLMADPAFYRQQGPEIAAARDRMETLEAELNASYDRWEKLEARREERES
jgi:ATP-binding cassette subfamily F protein uup